MNKFKFISVFILMIALSIGSLLAGGPIPGLDITIEQIPGGETFKTKTNNKGEFSFKNLPNGHYILTLSYKGKSAVIGKKPTEKIQISAGSAKNKTFTLSLDKSSPKLAKALSANYNSSRSNKSANRRVDHNTTRSNKTRAADHNSSRPKGSLRAEDHNSSRSNEGARSRGDGLQDGEEDKNSPKVLVNVNDDRVFGHVTVLK